MSLILVSIIVSVILVVGLLVTNVYYQSVMKLPSNAPSKYLKQQSGNDKQRPVLVLLGDSITHGRIGVNYADIVADQLEDRDLEIVNAGINSELAWNALQRLNEVIDCEPDIVTVLIGTNDANATMSKDIMRGYIRNMKLPREPSSEWYRRSLISIVEGLKVKTTAKIALLSIPTIGENTSDPAFMRSSEYSTVVKEVAEETDATYLPLHEEMREYLHKTYGNVKYPYEKYKIGIIKAIISRYLFRRSWDDIARGSGFTLHVDYLHLNTAGAQMVADLISDFIQSTLPGT
jgi:lysophospholipase L1-like esterase